MLFMVSYPLLNRVLSLSFPSAETAQPLLRQASQIARVLGGGQAKAGTKSVFPFGE